MKELTTEAKAKAYDEAIEKFGVILNLNTVKESGTIFADDVRKIFPELAESEDERMRKELIELVKETHTSKKYYDLNKMIAWLEKQGEQKPADKVKPKFKVKYEGNEYNVLYIEDIAGVTFYGIEDEPNHIYYVLPNNCEIISEQKPADKIEPKFKVGDTIRPKGYLAEYTIESISGECYHGKGWGLAISGDNEYELVRHKSVEWSEEDETGLSDALWAIQQARAIAKDENDMGNLWYAEHWLKSLRHQNRWKPSDEQIEALEHSLGDYNIKIFEDRYKILKSLYQDLKKLKEE